MNHHSNSPPHLPSSAIYFRRLADVPLICFRPGPVSVCPGEHVKHVKHVKPQSSCLVNGSKWKQDRNILHHFAKCLANVSRLRDNSALKSPGAKALFHQCTDPLTVLTAQIWRFGNSQIPLLWQIPSWLSWFHHDPCKFSFVLSFLVQSHAPRSSLHMVVAIVAIVAIVAMLCRTSAVAICPASKASTSSAG